MSYLERQKKLLEFTAALYFKAYINLGWKKLYKYYSLFDRTYAYCAAIYLNSSLRNEWFINKWSDLYLAWIKNVNTTMEQLYKTYQRFYLNERIKVAQPLKKLNEFEQYNKLSKTIANIPELDRYRKEPLLEGDSDIIYQWRDNRKRYPILAWIALDLLAVPATTAVDERVFSQADDVINDERGQLSEDTAEAMQCLRSWILAGLVDLRQNDDIELIFT